MEINSNETETDETMLIRTVIRRMDNKINNGDLDHLHTKRVGVRSRQIGALIEVLVQCGVITEKNLFLKTKLRRQNDNQSNH